MELTTLLLFAFTALPLICTPGPDILFTASQGLSSGPQRAVGAVAGILLKPPEKRQELSSGTYHKHSS